MLRFLRSGSLLVLLIAAVAHAQSGVKVELDEVTDNRMSEGMMRGSLDVRVKLDGAGLDKAAAARILLKEARDDRGNVLTGDSASPDFTPRDYNMGTLQLALKTPPREASSVRIKGTLELYIPSRDPNAVVKIDKALSKLDTPLASKTLKAAKIEITPLSADGYAKLQKSRKIDDKALAEIRAEGKKRGVPEKEIEMAIEFAKAMETLDGGFTEGSVALSGEKSDFDRVYRIEILGADGQPLDITSRSISSRGEASLMTLDPSAPVPENASLQLMLLTDKSRLSVPFELNVPLP